MLTYVLFVVGLVFLIKGADFLVAGASSIAKRMQVSDLVIGLTIVAIGTSAPELFVNIIAASKGTTDIAIGNIVGSNIANIFLILGVTAVLCPIKVTGDTIWKQVPFSLLASLALAVLVNDALFDGAALSALTRIDGLILLMFFCIFMYYLFGIAQTSKTMQEESGDTQEKGIPFSIGLVILGLAGLSFGSNWIVDGAVHMARVFGLGEKTIGVTIIAFGTSLPELAASFAAAKKKKVDLAVGNVIGSNLLNVFLILGISATIFPLPLAPGMNTDILVMIAANLFVFGFMFTGGRSILDRWEGGIMLAIYIGYMGYLFVEG
ncbi:MAG: sodium:proton exchanger [Chloroflexi bacterium]|nr:sodium:proton exchanger [Chloroflexota bacterium]